MIEVPTEWPPAVAECYHPVRVLGKGGFASVVLGQRRVVSDGDGQQQQLHALKVVGSRSHRVAGSDMAYAVREIEILSELDHPNVMKLIDRWEDKKICVMALSYHAGPTLQAILDVGGRLGLTFARVVCAQLIDVVEYLHCRAVVHRDIKPDNMIVSIQGDFQLQDEIWDDDDDDDPANSGADNAEIQNRWRRLYKNWKLTLIDFGFARALTPCDVKKKPTNAETDLNLNRKLEESTRSTFSDKSLRRSLSRRFVRTMSAVGHQSYAAPEIINGVHDEHIEDVKVLTSSSGHAVTDVTRTLSDHVAYYGLLVDSYSVGNVIRYCLTGVPPDRDVNDTIALENGLFPTLCRCLCSMLQSSSTLPKRRVKYRAIGKIPREVIRLIRGLTHPDSQKRTSMRAARLYPWVNDVLVDSDYMPPTKTSYLSFACEHHQHTVEEGEDDSSVNFSDEKEAAPEEC